MAFRPPVRPGSPLGGVYGNRFPGLQGDIRSQIPYFTQFGQDKTPHPILVALARAMYEGSGAKDVVAISQALGHNQSIPPGHLPFQAGIRRTSDADKVQLGDALEWYRRQKGQNVIPIGAATRRGLIQPTQFGRTPLPKNPELTPPRRRLSPLELARAFAHDNPPPPRRQPTVAELLADVEAQTAAIVARRRPSLRRRDSER
jgi:hypothetical protein